jgi:M6 family metalloprotease-like protein/uncharacterized delta-60 repeat protein
MAVSGLLSAAGAVPPSPDAKESWMKQGALEQMMTLHHNARLRGAETPTEHPFILRSQDPTDTPDTLRVIVLLIDFSDNRRNPAFSSVYFQRLLFSRNRLPSGSMADYYMETSYNGVLFVGQVTTRYYRMPQTYAYYTNNQSGLGNYPQNAQKMAEDAIALANPDVNFAHYDNDGDGIVEGVYVAHAGGGAENELNPLRAQNMIWSLAWNMPNPPSVDGKIITDFLTIPGAGTIGVICHETGHLIFGWPDLYDTTPQGNTDSEGLGHWSLMAGGNWLGTPAGSRPCHPDAFCKIEAGFLTAEIVTENATVALPAVETSPSVHRLWTNGELGTEYFLVENRQRLGFDDNLPGDGLLLYHVDDTQLDVNNNNNPWYPAYTDSGHYLVALEQADGLWQLEQNINQGDAGDPWPGSQNATTFDSASTPNSDSYAFGRTYVAIRNISPSQAIMTADFEVTSSDTGGTQLWAQRYNGPNNGYDQATDLAMDNAGNVYVTGASQGVGTSTDYATLKYNSAGVLHWEQRYNGPASSYDHPSSIAVDGTGNVYVTGRSDVGGIVYDYLTIKYNSTGVLQWEQRYNGLSSGIDEAKSIAVDGVGNVYVTGMSWNSVTQFDYATIKYDTAGVQQWVQRYDGPISSSDHATSIAADSAGNVYVTGYSPDNNTGTDYATIKYNTAGVQQWVQRYNHFGNSTDVPSSLVVDGIGNIYVTGRSMGTGTGFDYATIKYNAAGVQQWVQRYTGLGSNQDYAESMVVDGDGNVYVTGSSDSDSALTSNDDYATIKYNSAGVQQWETRYNGPGNSVDRATSLAVDGVGNVYVTGYGDTDVSLTFNYNYITIKYNPAGAQQWVTTYNGPGNDADQATSLVLDGFGNVCITGSSIGFGYDYATIKYTGGTTIIANWQSPEALVFGSQEPVQEYRLNACYPNPFNASTIISYKLQAASFVNLKVYDIAGRLVTTLVNGWRDAGTHELTFSGAKLTSGMYFCRMQAGNYSSVQKIVLLK